MPDRYSLTLLLDLESCSLIMRSTRKKQLSFSFIHPSSKKNLLQFFLFLTANHSDELQDDDEIVVKVTDVNVTMEQEENIQKLR